MKFQEPTFEEYKTATVFARFKYKYALIVLIGCWICLVLLIYFVWNYQDELATHPGIYTVEKLGVNNCVCFGDSFTYYINKTSISYEDSIFGG